MIKNVAWISTLSIAIFLLLSGVYFLLNKKDASPVVAPETAVKQGLAKNFVEVPLIGKAERQEQNARERYAYNIQFPTIALVNNPERAKEANAVIATLVDDAIGNFKKNVAELFSQDTPKDFTSDLTMRFTAQLVSPTIISIRFDSSEYIAGAAHPNSQITIWNYDIEHRAILGTADLFASSTDALFFLSQHTREELNRAITNGGGRSEEYQDMIVPGTEPTNENFANIALTKDGVTVIFNPYQVAPYARGSQEVRIPLPLISGHLSARIEEAIRLGNTNIAEATPE